MLEVTEDNVVEQFRQLLGERGRGGQDCLWNIPSHMHGALARYIMLGIGGGKFLNGIMCNNFIEANLRADDVNARHMRDWAMLIYNDLPMKATGSPEKVKAWMDSGGIIGQRKTRSGQ